METIREILGKYSPEDVDLFRKTVDELFSKGVPKGCFQDYSVLADVSSILTACEFIIKEGEQK